MVVDREAAPGAALTPCRFVGLVAPRRRAASWACCSSDRGGALGDDALDVFVQRCFRSLALSLSDIRHSSAFIWDRPRTTGVAAGEPQGPDVLELPRCMLAPWATFVLRETMWNPVHTPARARSLRPRRTSRTWVSWPNGSDPRRIRCKARSPRDRWLVCPDLHTGSTSPEGRSPSVRCSLSRCRVRLGCYKPPAVMRGGSLCCIPTLDLH